jgi:hypothetical protein
LQGNGNRTEHPLSTPFVRLPVLVLALVAAAACTGPEEDRRASIDDESQLLEVVNENRRLEAELAESERRLVEDCLEEQGFAVHDQVELATRWHVAEQEALVEDYPFASFLPDPEAAAEWGYGQWAYSDEGWASGAGDAFNEATGADQPWLDLDNTAFDDLALEEKRAWYAAFGGEEYAASIGGFSSGATADDDSTEGGDDGAIVIDPELQEAVAPGGCLLEMVEAVHGEAEAVPATGGAVGTVWTWGPRSPQEAADWEALREAYREAVIEPEAAFLECVAAGGWGDWEFDRTGGLPVAAYFNQIYYPDSEIITVQDGLVVEPGSVPEPPEDLPSDLESQQAYEIDMALGFIDCAEATGYREAAEAAYHRVHLDLFLTMDEELYAYQDDLRGVIAAAQEVLGG